MGTGELGSCPNKLSGSITSRDFEQMREEHNHFLLSVAQQKVQEVLVLSHAPIKKKKYKVFSFIQRTKDTKDLKFNKYPLVVCSTDKLSSDPHPLFLSVTLSHTHTYSWGHTFLNSVAMLIILALYATTADLK